MVLMIVAQLALLLFVIVMLLRMTRAQERSAAALERLADRRDPGTRQGPPVADS
jgi:HAMP domain-containing protein